MANPLQPKIIKVLEKEYRAYVINVTGASKSGTMDIVACIPRSLSIGEAYSGLFYGFEIKWKNDKPSELQKEKINKCIDAKGSAYFIRSVDQLRDILDNNIPPTKYKLKNTLVL